VNKALLRRIGISLLIGLVLGILINEITFAFLREDSRPPERILMVIPDGTADLVAQGQQPPSLPESMLFVIGDTLVVRNDDRVDHQLGPLWIPAGSEASLQKPACNWRPAEILSTRAAFRPRACSIWMSMNR